MIKTRPSGAFIHTFRSGQTPSRILVRIASSVYPVKAAALDMVTFLTISVSRTIQMILSRMRCQRDFARKIRLGDPR
ncbi:MAG: hypothetical protein ACYCZR_03115 [Burkholderiales bacterium]